MNDTECGAILDKEVSFAYPEGLDEAAGYLPGDDFDSKKQLLIGLIRSVGLM